MAELTITIKGIPELVERLGRAASAIVLAGAMEKGISRVQATLQRYPAPPPNSTYTRTGDLGRSWTTKPAITVDGGGVTAEFGNAARSRRAGQAYAAYVQRDQSEPDPHQTGRHAATGWVTDVQALDQNAPLIEGDFANAIAAAL